MTTEVQTSQNAQAEVEPKPEKSTGDVFSDTIVATNSPKIIDLNNSLVNFNTAFTVKSETSKPFKVIAVNEKALDKADDLQFRTAESGQISGQIFSDIDQLTNYILVIKTIEEGEEMNCTVDITRSEIPAWSRTKKPPVNTPVKPPVNTPVQNNNMQTPPKQPPVNSEKIEPATIESYVPEKEQSFFSKYRMYIFGLIILCILALVGYFLFYKKAGASVVPSDTESVASLTEKPGPAEVNVPKPRTEVMDALNSLI
jgi:hypothetical protein